MEAVRLRGGEIRYVVANYNDCLDRYERASDDLMREKVIWRDAGLPW